MWLLLMACGARDPDIVMVVVDTLRADYLGTYGYARHETSPAMDRFANEARVFERAYAPAPWTLPSTATLLTGLSPRKHGARTPRTDLAPEIETLAEQFHAEGWNTCLVYANPLMDTATGLHQGFEHVDGSPAMGGWTPTATEVTEAALDCLDERGSTFAVIQYFDPHDPYLDHEDIDFAGPGELLESRRYKMTELREMQDELGEVDVARLRDLYAEEVRYTDDRIAPLLDTIREQDTFILTSDHGEDILDHGHIGHLTHLHEELVRVPLIVQMPGLEPGRDRSVTPLERLGPALRGAPQVLLQSDEALFEVERMREGIGKIDLSGVVLGTDKQVHDCLAETRVRYDLASDPLERAPLEAQEPLGASIEAYRAIEPIAVLDLAAEAKREAQLKALGYLD